MSNLTRRSILTGAAAAGAAVAPFLAVVHATAPDAAIVALAQHVVEIDLINWGVA
jgi:cobalamin biosynthesis protein CbiD